MIDRGLALTNNKLRQPYSPATYYLGLGGVTMNG